QDLVCQRPSLIHFRDLHKAFHSLRTGKDVLAQPGKEAVAQDTSQGLRVSPPAHKDRKPPLPER
ncbi:MAG: hypothetical protein K1X67_19250, partial [Fimbriimonadaceae bacterium]|nr:hypothetical protein [Fimbriimonadaceae bacterium]